MFTDQEQLTRLKDFSQGNVHFDSSFNKVGSLDLSCRARLMFTDQEQLTRLKDFSQGNVHFDNSFNKVGSLDLSCRARLMFTDQEQLTRLKDFSQDHTIAVMGLTEEGEESFKVLTGNHGWSDVYLPSRPHCIETDSIVTSKMNNLEAVRFSLISAGEPCQVPSPAASSFDF